MEQYCVECWVKIHGEEHPRPYYSTTKTKGKCAACGKIRSLVLGKAGLYLRWQESPTEILLKSGTDADK